MCKPLAGAKAGSNVIEAGQVDSPGKMIGDINFFLYPCDDDDEQQQPGTASPRYCVGEVDIMIAEVSERGKGLGRGAVTAFLHYIFHNLAQILHNYGIHNRENTTGGGIRLKRFMAKIKEDNAASLALFKSLGFHQQGPASYFGEVTLVLEDYVQRLSKAPDGYTEMGYMRLD